MSGPLRVQVTVRGDADYAEADAARAAVERAIASARCPVHRADVVLYARHGSAAPAAELEAVVDVGGAQVHATGSAWTVREAADVLENRLGARLAQVTDRAQRARRVPRSPGRRTMGPR